MEKFSVFVNNVDSLVWSMVLVVLCLGVGLYLSIRLKFPQIRLMKVKDMMLEETHHYSEK